jgi:hypothetical protein
MSVNDTVAQDKSGPFALDSTRQQLDNAIRDLAYGYLNRPAWQVAAAAVAPPVCATATVTSQVKTTATTQMYIDGVPLSLTATDNLWTNAIFLAANAVSLAAGSVRRYMLLWDGSSATTVVSMYSSNDQVIANFTTSALALAACRWPGPIPKNATGGSNVVVGVLSIVNVTNPFVPGTTLLGAAGVTATYRDGPDANCLSASLLSP